MAKSGGASGDSSSAPASDKPKKEAWQPVRKAGESRAAYLKRFYTGQRIHAEETGDQSTVNKIYGKLGKKSLVGARKGDNSLNVDANTTDKAALAAIPAMAAGGRGLGMMARGGARAAASEGATSARAIASKGAQKALPASRVARPVAKAQPASGVRKLSGGVNRLPKASDQKALPSGKQSLAKPSSPSSRGALSGGKAKPAPAARGNSSKRVQGSKPNRGDFKNEDRMIANKTLRAGYKSRAAGGKTVSKAVKKSVKKASKR